ncbi:MAG TPA: Crp/Fnr family transcriptional regulator [Promineifilum sp.]
MVEFSVIDRLRRLPYFAGAALSQVQQLAALARLRHFVAGDLIFQEGAPSAGLWIIESGRVKAYKLSPNGDEYILRIFGPGETFNDLAALDGAPNAANTSAISAVSAWVIPAAAFSAALQSDHELALAVIRGLIERQRRLVAQAEDLALRTVTGRLARFLLLQVSDPALTHPSVTRSLIANHLATTSESISRSLRSLESAGAIRFDRHRIFITDPEKLHQIAQG